MEITRQQKLCTGTLLKEKKTLFLNLHRFVEKPPHCRSNEVAKTNGIETASKKYQKYKKKSG
jgi:hypothetical protein